MTTDPITQAREALARHRSQSAGDPFRFANHLYVALRTLTAHTEKLERELRTARNVVKDYDTNFPCDGGCNTNDGPEETCSRHGRSPRDLWERGDYLATQRDEWKAKAEARPQVTDEMVERAARAGHEYLLGKRPPDHGPYAHWEDLDNDYRDYLRGIQRAALEAALNEGDTNA